MLIKILIGTALLIGANYALKYLLQYFRKHTKSPIEHILHLPLQIILWIIGCTYLLQLITEPLGISPLIAPLRLALTISCLAWIAIRWKRIIQEHFISHSHIDHGMIHILGRLTSIGILLISGLLILQVLGINIFPLVAFGSVGAAAVGLAGKDVISNFFSGFMLYLNHAFKEGDLILIPARDIEGYVEEIGWYMTCIRDKDKCAVYLPNSLFSKELVINASRRTHRPIRETLRLRFEDAAKVTLIVDDLRSLLHSHPSIDSDQSLLIGLTTLNEYSLDIQIQADTTDLDEADYFATKQDILLKAQQIALSHGAEIPIAASEVFVNH